MTDIKIKLLAGPVSNSDQHWIHQTFIAHTDKERAPAFDKQTMAWIAYVGDQRAAALTAATQWDWLYVDELVVDAEFRRQGLGSQLMAQAEAFAKERGLVGIWLWTQSWQAEHYYPKLGYEEFARFEDNPKGYYRLGFRKVLPKSEGLN